MSKRRSRGHLAKKGNNYYAVLYQGKDPAGKTKYRWIPAGQDWKIANQLLIEELHKLDKGIVTNPGKETTGEYITRWLESMNGQLSPRTVEGYMTLVRRIIPVIGDIPLRKLSTVDIQAYLNGLLKEDGRLDGKGALSGLTVGHHARFLHRALRDAVVWKLIAINPVDSVNVPRVKSSDINIMSTNEVKVFLEAAKETDYFPLFHTFLATGARRSEVLALRWRDFDELLLTLSISRSLHHLHNGKDVFRPVKSAKGKRVIALSPTTVKVLQDHRERQTLMKLEMGTMLQDNDLIFSRWDGSPLRPDSVSHAWTKLATKLGISAARLHDARHTHASLMLKQGIHPKIVQERLGHSTISLTLDIYSHTIPGLQEAAARKFDEVFQINDNEIDIRTSLENGKSKQNI